MATKGVNGAAKYSEKIFCIIWHKLPGSAGSRSGSQIREDQLDAVEELVRPSVPWLEVAQGAFLSEAERVAVCHLPLGQVGRGLDHVVHVLPQLAEGDIDTRAVGRDGSGAFGPEGVEGEVVGMSRGPENIGGRAERVVVVVRFRAAHRDHVGIGRHQAGDGGDAVVDGQEIHGVRPTAVERGGRVDRADDKAAAVVVGAVAEVLHDADLASGLVELQHGIIGVPGQDIDYGGGEVVAVAGDVEHEPVPCAGGDFGGFVDGDVGRIEADQGGVVVGAAGHGNGHALLCPWSGEGAGVDLGPQLSEGEGVWFGVEEFQIFADDPAASAGEDKAGIQAVDRGGSRGGDLHEADDALGGHDPKLLADPIRGPTVPVGRSVRAGACGQAVTRRQGGEILPRDGRSVFVLGQIAVFGAAVEVGFFARAFLEFHQDAVQRALERGPVAHGAEGVGADEGRLAALASLVALRGDGGVPFRSAALHIAAVGDPAPSAMEAAPRTLNVAIEQDPDMVRRRHHDAVGLVEDGVE